MILAIFSGHNAKAQISWDGGGGNTLWSNPLNWSGDVLPTSGQTVTINNAAVDWDITAAAGNLPSGLNIDLNGSTLANITPVIRLNNATIDVDSGSTLSGSFWDLRNGTLSFQDGAVVNFADWEQKGTNVFNFEIGATGFSTLTPTRFRNDQNNPASPVSLIADDTYNVDLNNYTGGTGIITLVDFGSDSEGIDDSIFQQAMLNILNANGYTAALQWNDVEEAIELVILAVPVVPDPPTPPSPPTPQVQPPQPAPTLTIVDQGAIAQLLGSAVPMNISVGQIVDQIHNVPGRTLNRRLHRLRSRHQHHENGHEVEASHFARSKTNLTGSQTIDLTASHSFNRDLEGQNFQAPLINDAIPALGLFTEQPAHYSHDPNHIIGGDNWEVYASADFGNYSMDNQGRVSHLESDTWAATAGIEFYINENLALGAGWSHVWNTSELSNGIGSFDIEGDAFMVYGSWFRNNFWADLFYSYGKYEANIQRNTFIGAGVSANPDLEAHQSTLNLGYNIPTGRFVHGPTFRADYRFGNVDGYTETGNTRANTRFEEQEYDSFITTLGWQVNWQEEACWGALHPSFRLGYGRQNLQQETAITGTLENSPITIIQNGTVIGRGGQFSDQLNRQDAGEGWLDFGAGVGMEFHNNWHLHFDYQARFFQENATLHYGTVKVGRSF